MSGKINDDFLAKIKPQMYQEVTKAAKAKCEKNCET